MARRLTFLLAACALGGVSLGASLLAHADMPMRDPTQPADASAAADGMPSESLSIIRPINGKTGAKPAGKPLAIVDGTLVSVGSKVGDATVMSIGTDRVVLKNADGSSETRLLTPDVDKTPVRLSPHSSNVARKP